MGRFNPSNINDVTVSTEGFWSSLGKVMGAVGAAYTRANAIAVMDFTPNNRPEVNGVSCKGYGDLSRLLTQAINSGEFWDLTLIVNTEVTDGLGNSTGVTSKVIVVFGTGRDATIRLPGYEKGDNTTQIVNFLASEFKIK